MEPIVALVAEPSLNLVPLTSRLWAEKIPHRVVTNHENKQCLLLANPADKARVDELLTLWKQGELEYLPIEKAPRASHGNVTTAIAKAPVSVVTLAILVLMYIWMHLSTEWYSWLTTAEHLWPAKSLSLQTYFDIGFWEMYRPVLLHFSLTHIVFNGLWWWILAPQIERLDGVKPLLVLIILCGFVGNAVQWWYAGPAFGGASGITMGFLGWVGIRLQKVPYPFPPMLLPVMVGIMLLTIATDVVLPGVTGTAHGAHIGGLVAGLLLGLVWPPKTQTVPQ